jgi:hypothetical protein
VSLHPPVGAQNRDELKRSIDVYPRFATGRKCAAALKKAVKIVFDELVPKWNDRALPDRPRNREVFQGLLLSTIIPAINDFVEKARRLPLSNREIEFVAIEVVRKCSKVIQAKDGYAARRGLRAARRREFLIGGPCDLPVVCLISATGFKFGLHPLPLFAL